MTNLTDPLRYDLLGVPNNTAGNAKATNSLFTANRYPFPSKVNRELLQLQYGNMEKTLGVFAGIDFTEGGNTFRDNEITDDDAEWAALNGGEGYYLFPTSNVKNGGWRRDPAMPSQDTNIRGDKYVVDPNQQSFFANLKAAALVLNKTDAIIAGTEIGGFDTHQNQVSNQASLFTELSQAMKAFYQAMAELNMRRHISAAREALSALIGSAEQADDT